MKKIIILIIVLCFNTLLSAQRYRLNDTVVVFKLKIKTQDGMVIKDVPYKTLKKLRWSDKQNMAHELVILGINARYLLLDTTRVYTSNINALVMTHLPISSQYAARKTRLVLFDSSGLFNVMSYYDFQNLLKRNSFVKTSHIHNPVNKNISYEEYTALLEKKRQRRIKNFAALDTCPLRYGIKTNLVKDLINEINLTVEVPITRNFCIDVGTGIFYSRSGTNSETYDRAFAQFPVLKAKNQFWFDHSYYNRKGFGIEVNPKFFLLKRKTLYIGPQLSYKYYYYQKKWVFINDEPDDYYYKTNYAKQSEKSSAVHLNVTFGVQTPPIKKFLFDAFVSFGCIYRGGAVSRYVEKTEVHDHGTFLINHDPPETFKGGGFSLSGQIGLRLGFRFGKAKLLSRKV